MALIDIVLLSLMIILNIGQQYNSFVINFEHVNACKCSLKKVKICICFSILKSKKSCKETSRENRFISSLIILVKIVASMMLHFLLFCCVTVSVKSKFNIGNLLAPTYLPYQLSATSRSEYINTDGEPRPPQS